MDINIRKSFKKEGSKGLWAFDYSNIAEATITNLDNPSQMVKCHFRPHEYTFVKANQWEETPAIGVPFNTPKYKSTTPYKLTMELLFDTNEAEGDPDVRNVTDILWKMMRVTEKKKNDNTQKSEPPWVEFRWGKSWTFKAVITQMTQQFTLFKPDGTPVRAKVKMDFLQAVDDNAQLRQNPTSGGVQGHRVHVVKDGETIDSIAFEEYGDSNAWRHLATTNELDDPTRLQAGQRLLLVPVV